MVGKVARAIRLLAKIALVLLAIVGVAHIATIRLRPDVRGMGASACQQEDGGKLAIAGLWLLWSSRSGAP